MRSLTLVPAARGFCALTWQPNTLRLVVCSRVSVSDSISTKSMLAANGYRRARGRSIKCFLHVHGFRWLHRFFYNGCMARTLPQHGGVLVFKGNIPPM